MSQVNRNKPRRGTASESRYTVFEFDKDFPDDTVCLEWLMNHLYTKGIHCPNCDAITKHHRVRSRTCYECQHCGHQEYPMKGTIFEGSATSLRLWFYAIFLMSSTRCGISAKQLERELGVTYKTAWRMFNKIRILLSEGIDDMGGTGGAIEADETYVGGKRKGTPRGRPGAGSHKTAVFGAVERGGRVFAVTVPNVKRISLIPHLTKRVLPASLIYTDELKSYDGLQKEGFKHDRINHSEQIYVAGDVHTNTIEGFWSLVKRGISGTYHSISSKYLQAYLDEYAFRYNHRKDAAGIFNSILIRVWKQAPQPAS